MEPLLKSCIMQTIIRVEKLAKTFNHHQALYAVDLSIHHGEMVALPGRPVPANPPLHHLSGLITGDKSASSHIEPLGVGNPIPVYAPPDEQGRDDLFKHPGCLISTALCRRL